LDAPSHWPASELAIVKGVSQLEAARYGGDDRRMGSISRIEIGMTRPYWVRFELQTTPSPYNLGVGVTADSEEDARQILAAVMQDAPPVTSVNPINELRDLDQGHVAPNMGNWFLRGIWFPPGYENSN
jgi:hypothetical protein